MDDDIDIPEGPDTPDYRATIRDGRVTLHDWFPNLATCGPRGQLLRDRSAAGVALADVTVLRTEDARPESIVAFVTENVPDAAKRAIVDWARTVGQRRVWLDDRIVDFHDLPAIGKVATSCRSCGMTWQERDESFWSDTYERGLFPRWCPTCGGTLDQWQRVAETAEPIQLELIPAASEARR